MFLLLRNDRPISNCYFKLYKLHRIQIGIHVCIYACSYIYVHTKPNRAKIIWNSLTLFTFKKWTYCFLFVTLNPWTVVHNWWPRHVRLWPTKFWKLNIISSPYLHTYGNLLHYATLTIEPTIIECHHCLLCYILSKKLHIHT